MKLLAAVIACLVLVVPAVAHGADPDPAQFTPRGYEFCGWLNFGTRGWEMQWDDDLAGAYTVLFAGGMSCDAARRNYAKLRYGKQPPYRAVRAGYRCQPLRKAHEFLDVRCTRKTGGVKFRYQTGA